MAPLRQKIAIIGSGLVGPLLAVFLARRGYHVDVFEKRSDPRLQTTVEGRSINLALSIRGIYALQQTGLWEEIKALTLPMRGRMIHDPQGRQELQPYGKDDTETILSVSRSALSKRIVDLADRESTIDIYFDHTCLDLDLVSGACAFQCAEQTIHRTYEVIFGCDGANSVVRQLLQQAGKTTVETHPLGHGYKELTLSSDPQGNFRMDPAALHIWPRKQFMLIALPNQDRSFTCTLFLANEGAESFAALDNPARVEDFFTHYFPDFAAQVPDLSVQFFTNPLGRLVTVYAQPWHYDGRVALIGDAAHAVVPFFGQGMNASFQDCTVLDEILQRNCADWSNILTEYSTTHVPNGHAIADLALENYIEMRDLVQDDDFLAFRAFERRLETWFPQTFIPRYSMVSFHRIPYREVVRRGQIQARIIKELRRQYGCVENLRQEQAAAQIKSQLQAITF